VCSSAESPIFYDIIANIAVERDDAQRYAAELRALIADVEALHEPNIGGECPTCAAPAPCLTLRLVHGLITLEQAFAAVREEQPIDLVAAEEQHRPAPPVPSLKELLAIAPSGVDRFFEALLADPPAKPHDSASRGRETA